MTRHVRYLTISTLLVWASASPCFAQTEGHPEGPAPSDSDPTSSDPNDSGGGADLDEATREKWTEAAKLFDEGRKKMGEQGGLDEACETLAKSYELRQRGDVLLNLAECHRRQGKTATAWREFDEAIRYAEEVQFTAAIDAAKKLRDELAQSLSGLMVTVPTDPPPPPDLVVILDDKPLPSAQWGQPLFVDPGTHKVSATAPGYERFDGTTEVKNDGHRAVIDVVLEKVPEPAVPPEPEPEPATPPPPPPPQASEVPVWPFIVGGAGIAMMGVAVVFGIDTASVGGELDDQCGEDRGSCPSSSSFDYESARDNELRSFGLFVGLGGAGIIATAVGAVGLGIALSDGGDDSSVAVTPWAGPNSAGIAIRGTTW